MPLPPSSFTLMRWTAFFAELSSKLSHHNPLVVLEGCEVLRRLLASHLSIAIFLQESTTLRTLLHTLTVSFQHGPSPPPPPPSSSSLPHTSPATATTTNTSHSRSGVQEDDVSLALLGTLCFILPFMRSLLAERDSYFSALVLSQAGAMMEALMVVLHNPHHCGYGWAAYIMGQLLQMCSSVSGGVWGLHTQLQATVAETPRALTVHVQRVLEELARLPEGWYQLPTQLAVMATHTSGPPQLAAQALLSRVQKLAALTPVMPPRSATPTTSSSAPPRPQHPPSASPQSTSALSFSGLAPDYTLASQLIIDGESVLSDRASTPCTTAANASVTLPLTPIASRQEEEDLGDESAQQPQPLGSPSVNSEDIKEEEEKATHTTTTSVTALQQQLCASILTAIGKSRSHADFLAHFQELWCLTTVAMDAVIVVLTPSMLECSLQRIVTTPPAHRRDVSVFSMSLQWLGELVQHGTGPAGLRLVATLESSLALPLLSLLIPSSPPTSPSTYEVEEGEGRSRYSTHRAADDVAARWEQGLQQYSQFQQQQPASVVVPQSDVLLLYPTVAHQKQTALLRVTPPLAPRVLSFLHTLQSSCAPHIMLRWVTAGDVFQVLLPILTAAAQRETPLLHVAPASSDLGEPSLRDEVYLRWSRAAAGDSLNVTAMLACRLVAGVCRGVTWSGLAPPIQLTTGLQAVVSALVTVVQQHPTLAVHHAAAASQILYHASSDFHCTRYASLGECAAYALDTCLWSSSTLQLHCVDVESLLPWLPKWVTVTQDSIHHAVRAVPLRCLRYLTRTPIQLSVVLAAVPQLLLGAVRSTLAYTPTGSQWEAGAAADWLLHLLSHLQEKEEIRDALMTTALPSQLLAVLLPSPVNYTTSRLLQLAVILAPHHSATDKAEGPSCASSNTGHTKLENEKEEDDWFLLVPKAIATLEELHRYVTTTTQRSDSFHISTTSAFISRSPLVPAQRIGIFQSVAAGWSYTASLLIGLRLSTPHLSPLQQLDETVKLLQAIVASPTPSEVRGMVRMVASSPTPSSGGPLWDPSEDERNSEGGAAYTQLKDAYYEMVAAVCQWVSVLHNKSFLEAIDNPDFWFFVAQRMRDESIEVRTRSLLPTLLLNHPLLGRQRSTTPSSSLPHSEALFLATLTLPVTPQVVATQCRLVYRFPEACKACVTEGTWLEGCLQDLQDTISALMAAEKGSTTASSKQQKYVLALSAVSCALASPQYSLDKNASLTPSLDSLHMAATALCDGVRLSITRVPTLQALKSLAGSRVGYRCLIQEVSRGGRHSVFSLLLSMLFPDAIPLEGMQTKVAMKRPSALLRGGNVTTSQQLLCYGVCVNACRVHTGDMMPALQRHRVLGLLCAELEEWDRTGYKMQPSFPIHRAAMQWLACLSFHPEMQHEIVSHSSCFNFLLERAGSCCSDSSSPMALTPVPAEKEELSLLSLLVLRNVCFSPRSRDFLCHDVRLLLTLKSALLFMDSVAPLVKTLPTSRFLNSGKRTPFTSPVQHNDRVGEDNEGGEVLLLADSLTSALSSWTTRMQNSKEDTRTGGEMPVLIRLRRHALAATALWALLDEPRNQSTVRRVLMRLKPAVPWQQLRQQEASGWCQRVAISPVMEDDDALCSLVEYPVEAHILDTLEQLEALLQMDSQ